MQVLRSQRLKFQKQFFRPVLIRNFSMASKVLQLEDIPTVNRPVGKKLVVACDGTWQNSDNGPDKPTNVIVAPQFPTNVVRITRALNHKDEKGTPQIVFYQRGIGTDSDTEDRLVSGLTGYDISEHIREAYAFVANNFDPANQSELQDATVPMDEIVIVGFSRGSYTARCIADLISTVGLLTKVGMESFWGIFGDWMMQNIPGHESEWFEGTYGKQIPFHDPRYKQQLVDAGLTRWGMPIRACCVFDTVGSLGIPLPFDSKNVKPYSFVNTKVAQGIQFAFHALAIDEKRHFYPPTLWEWPDQPNRLSVLKQCWFPGCHSNIGGSYEDSGISNISLAWMISQLEDHENGILSFDPKYLDWIQDQNVAYYSKAKEVRPWGFGKLYDSTEVTSVATFAQAIDPIVRTPGEYNEVSPETGLQTNTPLKRTEEYIHRCVRVRIDGHGSGLEEQGSPTELNRLFNLAKKALHLIGVYNPPALKDYQLIQSAQIQAETDHSGGPSGVIWQGKNGKVLPEDTLGKTEIRLLKRSMQIPQME